MRAPSKPRAPPTRWSIALELLDSAARDNHRAIAHERRRLYAGRLRAVVAGTRRTFDVLDFVTESGSAGIGIDATEAETMRGALATASSTRTAARSISFRPASPCSAPITG